MNDPVVTEDGLIGLVTRVSGSTARVTLLTDGASAVSAVDVRTNANGIVRHGRASRSTLVLDRVPKEEVVRIGDTVVTAGWQSQRLTSLYPRGIPIGQVTSVGQTDTDLYKQVLRGAVRGLPLARRRPRARPEAAAGVIVTGAPHRRSWSSSPAIFQVAVLLRLGRPRRLSRTCCSSRSSAWALLRGATAGAIAGFAGGLLVDTATLGTLGRHLAAARRRRALGGPLRRDDRPRPAVRAVPRRRR